MEVLLLVIGLLAAALFGGRLLRAARQTKAPTSAPAGHVGLERDGSSSGTPLRAGPKQLQLRYCDAEGRVTARLIDLRRVESEGPIVYLVAWCHLRRDLRNFRLDRCLDIVDLGTGEVFDDPDEWYQEELEKARRSRR